ncbi:MAG TPA: PhzF family phenazine biosynthesis protein [Bacilli bacterium]|nr:PhzF family phenazine biosynthesis protein [Bacilli bacterium]
MKIFHVDAFTDTLFGGNAAGVALDAGHLAEQQMQQIARELNLSETAFLLPSNNPDAHLRVRYFTPTSEIDFCGHATIGLAWVLGTVEGWTERVDRLVLETNIGLVPVDWQLRDSQLEAVVMTQVSPQTKEIDVPAEEVAALLGLAPTDLDDRYPIRLGNTGNWHLLVPVKNRTAIDRAVPDLSRLEALNRRQTAATTHLFTFESETEGLDLYTRDFAPAVGIPEDPVTGSANGAMAGYLVLDGILSPDQTHRLRVGQGHTVGRPGQLLITITSSEQGPVVQVGGSAVISLEGVMRHL